MHVKNFWKTIWNQSEPITENSRAWCYLVSRGLKPRISQLKNLRFHKELFFEIGVRRPALIAACFDIEGQIAGISRIFLEWDEKRNADFKKAKKHLGNTKEKSVWIEFDKTTTEAAVAEGIEKGLAVNQVTCLSTLVLLSATNFKIEAIPKSITTLRIFADNDRNGIGNQKAIELANAAARQGLQVYLYFPKTVIPIGEKSWDWLDELTRNGEISITQAITSTPKFEPVQSSNLLEENDEPELTVDFGGSRFKPLVARSLNDTPRGVMEFVIAGLFPKGLLCAFTGKGGIGKSYFLIALAALMSKGGTLLGRTVPIGKVLYLNTDDDHEKTLAPRFDDFDFDGNRILLIEEGLNLDSRKGKDEDYKRIEHLIAQHRPDIFMIDPIMAQLGQGAGTNDATEVYARMRRLNDLAKKYDTTIVVIRHSNKLPSLDPSDAGTGSSAFTNAVRFEALCFRHPEDRDLRIVLPTKANDSYQDDQNCIGFRITKDKKFSFETIPGDGRELYRKAFFDQQKQDKADKTGTRGPTESEKARSAAVKIFETNETISASELWKTMEELNYKQKNARDGVNKLVSEGLIKWETVKVPGEARGTGSVVYTRINENFFAKLKAEGVGSFDFSKN